MNPQLLLQSHCVRLGIVTGKDLAQASRENYPRFVNLFLYLLTIFIIINIPSFSKKIELCKKQKLS